MQNRPSDTERLSQLIAAEFTRRSTMAFGSASGYSNLPNGNFSPVIYSKKVQKARSYIGSSVGVDVAVIEGYLA